MRRELAVIALVAGSSRAHADDLQVLLAADSYLATEPGYTADDAADLAWSAHVEWRTPERTATLDWVDRESLIGTAPRRELHELSYVDRSIDHLMFAVGRIRVPGGFWLMADGAKVAGRWDEVELGVVLGSRSFTNARVDTLLTSSPDPLPLAGIALTKRGAIQGALSYTYTSDRIELYRGIDSIATSTQPEQFFDADLIAPIGEHLYVTGGATVGSRYLVTYPTTAAQIADDPQVANVWFGSQAAYAAIDWRVAEWRFDGNVAALRTQLGQVTDPAALASITGSFVEGTARATWRRTRAWHVDAKYRARVWADRRHAERAQVVADWRHGALAIQLSAGVDIHRNEGIPGYVDGTSLLYRASIGRKTTTTELAVGAAAVSAIGDEVSAVPTDADDTRAPYTLEARSYGFVRAFRTYGGWFGGFDGEVDLYGGGIRALLQLGWAR